MEAATASSTDSALKNTIGKLGSFLWNEALLLTSVREDIQFIRDELQSMEGFLQDMIITGHLNNQMKVWMFHVLEVTCDAELCIDKFNSTLGDRRSHGIVSFAQRSIRFVWTIVPRYRLAKMIQMLKQRAKEVSERRSRYATETPTQETQATYNLTGRVAEAYNNPLVRYNHLIREDALVGIDFSSLYRLMKPSPRPAVPSSTSMPPEEGDLQVTPSGYNCIVLAIVGPTGSGKTALAKMLYRRQNDLYNPTLCAAWVTLSPEPDIKLVLTDILRQISNKPDPNIEHDDEEKLRKKVQRTLQDKSRFLIILDSLRSEEDWKNINPTLPQDGLHHGRVVVTTRSKKVAEACCSSVEHIRHLKPLSENQHSKLVRNLYFKHRQTSTSHHQEAAPAIKYCCSVPLALKSVWGVLSGAGTDIRTINRFSIEVVAIMVQNIATDDKVAQVVKLCCSYLNPSLKQCFKDLSILPEGYIIKRKRLIRRWMANGLVSSTGGSSTEAVAESYFDKLISRCIVEPEIVCPAGKIKSCRINGVFKNCIATPGTTENQGAKQQVPNPHNASFQLYGILPFRMLNYVRDKLPSTNPESLTVLDLEGCDGLSKQDLNDLCKFVQLKLLSLKNTDAHHLPGNIGELGLLETLDIRHTKIEKVPKGILKLRNLKHFLAGYSYKPENNEGTTDHLDLFPNKVEVPAGMEDLSALETLAHVNVTKASKLVQVVRYLKKLRKLGLVITEKKLNSRPLCISLMMMSDSLRSLSVHDEREGGSLEFLIFLCFPPQRLESLDLMGYLGKLPNWVTDHKLLSKLTLSETRLSSDAISSLGNINSLLCLKLYPNSLIEDVLTLGKDKFTKLRVLIVHCYTIQVIHFEKSTAQELEVFKWVMSKKKKMVEVNGMENLPMLKHVSLIGHVSPIISHDINYAIQSHPNRQKSLVFESIEKEIREHSNAIKTERQRITSKLEPLSKQAQAFFQGK